MGGGEVTARLEWLTRAAPDLVQELLTRALTPRPVAPSLEQWLKVSQVCERTGVTHRTVRAWIRGGFLKATHWGRSREWRVRQSDLETFLNGERQ